MKLKNKLINSNTFLIIKYGNGFKYIAIAVSLSLIATFFDIKTISLVPELIKSISNGGELGGAFNFILFALLSGFLRIILAYVSSKINTIISSNISNKIIDSTELVDIYELEKFGVSKLSQVFSNDIQTITNELIYPLLQIITSLILSFSITIFLILKIPFITITISIIYISLYFIFIKTSKSKIRKNSSKTANIRSKFVQSANEIIISARYLKNSLRSKRVIEYLKNNDLSIKRMSAQNNFLSVYPKYISESFGLISIALIGWISSSTGNTEIISVLGILALSIQKIIPSFQSIFVAISAINCNSANINRMNELISLSNKKNSLGEKLKIINRIGIIKNIYSLNSVKQNKEVLLKANLIGKDFLESISFKLFHNEWTGIIGPSGAGKTTFMDLITGVAIPLNSKNKFNTHNGNLTIEMSKKLNFIYLSQFNYIPSCSIIEYIVNSNDMEYLNQNRNYVIKLLKSIGLFDELGFKNSHNLFETLTENASSISGGQAQRLNILRTIFDIKNTKNTKYNVLAMDEPFKGLDEDTKYKCIALLKKVYKTAILITHSRNEAKELCNNVYKIG